jgi:hypothetical protein
MSTLSERAYSADWLKWITNVNYCLQVCTIDDDAAATVGLVSGEVLETSSSKKIVCATGSSADSILIEPVSLADLQGGETKRLCLVIGPAVIDSDKINVASAQKADALTALAVLGIKAVNSALTSWSTQST